MSAEASDVRPDLHKIISLLDDVLGKAEAGRVLPEHVRIHLKEERALLLKILNSLGGETGSDRANRRGR